MRWHIIVHLLPRLHQQVLLIINEYEIGEELDGLGLEQSSEGSILQITWIERDTLLIFSCHSLSDLRADEAVLNVHISELVVLNLPLLFDQVGLGVLVAVIQVDLGWLLRDVLLPELRLLVLQVRDDDELVVLWLSQDALFRVLRIHWRLILVEARSWWQATWLHLQLLDIQVILLLPSHTPVSLRLLAPSRRLVDDSRIDVLNLASLASILLLIQERLS